MHPDPPDPSAGLSLYDRAPGEATGLQPDSGGRKIFLSRARASLRYALQPIVNIHTGSVFGYEAVLQGVTAMGFQDAEDLLVHASDLGIANALDAVLRELAIALFAELPHAERCRLLFNLDPNPIALEHPKRTLELLERHGLAPETFCPVLSVRADPACNPHVEQVIHAYRQQRMRFAIDDLGNGCAGLRQLYAHPPDLAKLDHFFIGGIAEDQRKRRFVANAVQLAHLLGIRVIAADVETERELLACREVGCDLVQGNLIAHPRQDVQALPPTYERVAEIHARNRRERPGDLALIEPFLEYIPPLHLSDHLKQMFDAFRVDKQHHVIPVLDAADQPLGLIHESDIKDLVYSNYGRHLILNPSFARRMLEFVRPCPVVDIHDSAERLLSAYSATVNPAGVIVTRDARYHSFISAIALLQLMEQKNLAAARDQNPLTKLPGNDPIHRYVSEALDDSERTWHLVYLDFDHFKAFNDHYGFRRGDRVILLFAELLRQVLGSGQWFVGHIGGDDFFAGIRDAAWPAVIESIRNLLAKFRRDVQSLYDPEDQRRGYLRATDRYGQVRDMPLMRCSAAMLEMGPGDDYGESDQLGQMIAELKHAAKSSASGLVLRSGARGTSQVIDATVPSER